ncbi:MAG: hypothetical protein JKY94_17770 [Rhodobacteraceae bacterium]|nr:hypothetical protein [Paracoccaceae bacterium]
MTSTRDFNLPAIWADAAVDVVPPAPAAGTAYRRGDATPSELAAAWGFSTIVDSSLTNQMLYLISKVLQEVDKRGVLGWSDLVNYDAVPAMVRASDGNFYVSTAASGPDEGAGVKDPTTGANVPGFWVTLSTSLGVGANPYTDEQAIDAVGGAMVPGAGIDIVFNDPADTITVSAESATTSNPGISELATDGEVAAASSTTRVLPVSALASLFGVSTRSGATTVTRFPVLVGGVFVEMILLTGTYSGTSGSAVFPVTFPNAVAFCDPQPTHNQNISNGKAAVTNLKTLSTSGFDFASGVESGTSDTFSATDLDGNYFAIGY